MYIKFKKAHEGYKSGETVETNADRANAYIAAGLAEPASKEKVQKLQSEDNEELQKTQEKNSNAGPNGKKK